MPPRSSSPSAPPAVARREEVVDTLHGVAVADPYRWLEDGQSPEVRAWSAAQTERTERLLGGRPDFPELRARMAALLSVGTVEPPVVVDAGATHPGGQPEGPPGGPAGTVPRYFYRRQGPAQDQPVLYVRDGAGPERAVLDPNARSGDGTVALDWWTPSWDGRFLAYGLSEGGSEDSTLRVLDVATGADLGPTEEIPRARYASVAWLPDSSGFFYGRYPARGQVPAGEEHYHRRIHEHVLGRSPAEDPVVFGEGRPLTDLPSVDISPSGRWLVIHVHMGWSRREVWLRDRAAGPSAPWIPLAVPGADAVYEAVAGDEAILLRTNDGAASTYALYRVDPTRPARADWQLVLPAGPDVLATAGAFGDDVLAVYIADARSVVRRFSAAGALIAEIPLPSPGTVHAVTGRRASRSGRAGGRQVRAPREAFFDFTSFAVPSRVYRVDLDTGAVTVWAEVAPPLDPDVFVVTRERALSRDGTEVSFFVTHRRDLPRDGTAPAVLTGYGGFNISQMPAWSGSRYAFLERGGVVVLANLRGGGEQGEGWHRAGMLERKQNVFDDAIAVAEHLVRTQVTAPSRLAILGGSNGGLLVGAAITQRPDLFRAAVCMVPLLDMLRYHRFLIARLWVPEYGSAEDPEQFGWLHAYSPYHHVVEGTAYPAVLFATAEGDTRVDPLHARKMTARMQHATQSGGQPPGSSGRPILLRLEGKAGHGAGKPISKRIDEAAYVYAFLFWQLGLTPR